ncbi:MAG: redox-regulated ATPase YchF [Chloroflexi bacterium RBG_16_48_8]|nr:MAG: redox-regulated ATPase YchF [Chloroflexi bacterium RBG_16_48_8]
MSLRIGIVGLPNVGKSTTFNALTKAQNAEVASYPFCTIKPNRAIVPIPDERVERLKERAGRPNAIHTTIEFVDIAGLVKGASRGEGLGNQFLANIRDVDLIVHIVRCFEDPNVAHVSENIDPRYDIEVVETELILADLEQLERKIERLIGQVKGDRKTYEPQLKVAEELRDHLDSGKPISQAASQDQALMQILNQELRFLTAKPVLFVINVDETGLEGESPCERMAHSMAKDSGADSVKLCAKLEEEMIDLEEIERQELLELVGVEESGLEKVIRLSYRRLGLISFFTMNENEVRAWTVQKGGKAPTAAGKIHTDFERGFIRAEVVPYERFMELGSMSAIRNAGELRIEGKEYEVQDGDIIYFRFNV